MSGEPAPRQLLGLQPQLSDLTEFQVSCFEICYRKIGVSLYLVFWKWNSAAVLNFTLSNQSSTLDWSTPLLHHHLEEHPRHLAASTPPNTSLRHVACFHFCPEPIQRSLLLLTSWSWSIRGFVALCVYSCFFLVFLVCVCVFVCLFASLVGLFDKQFPRIWVFHSGRNNSKMSSSQMKSLVADVWHHDTHTHKHKHRTKKENHE